jgi:AcrR family transcriptional regulator
MSELVLTKDSILEATEVVLRHFGPSKANVVDVARALKVSHGAVYRHFPSKSALRDAVVRKWLAEMMPPLDAIVEEKGAASDRFSKPSVGTHLLTRNCLQHTMNSR